MSDEPRQPGSSRPCIGPQLAAATCVLCSAGVRVTRVGMVATLLRVAVFGVLAWQSMQLEAATCEVCIAYHGNEKCRTVGGATVDEARQAAVINACAFLSSGVTDSMACQRTPPISENCR